MRRPDKYGSKYWCIGVPEGVAPDGRIYAMADRAEVSNGALLLIRDSKLDESDGGYKYVPLPKSEVLLAFAPGQWLFFFAASLFDGEAITVEHWTGELYEPKRSEEEEERGDPPPAAKPANGSKRRSYPERHKMTEGLRYRVMKRDGFKCKACGKCPQEDGVSLEVDHIIPISKGGTSDEENLRTLCKGCNQSKRDGHP